MASSERQGCWGCDCQPRHRSAAPTPADWFSAGGQWRRAVPAGRQPPASTAPGSSRGPAPGLERSFLFRREIKCDGLTCKPYKHHGSSCDLATYLEVKGIRGGGRRPLCLMSAHWRAGRLPQHELEGRRRAVGPHPSPRYYTESFCVLRIAPYRFKCIEWSEGSERCQRSPARQTTLASGRTSSALVPGMAG